jgi:hypothetical protein
LEPRAAERSEHVDRSPRDLGTGKREGSLGIGEGAFGIELRQAVDLALALLSAGSARSGSSLISRRLQRGTPLEDRHSSKARSRSPRARSAPG